MLDDAEAFFRPIVASPLSYFLKIPGPIVARLLPHLLRIPGAIVTSWLPRSLRVYLAPPPRTKAATFATGSVSIFCKMRIGGAELVPTEATGFALVERTRAKTS